MRRTRIKVAAAVGGLALVLAGCGDAGGEGEGSVDVEAEDVEEGKFEEGSRMAEIAESGEIAVGIRIDQPGLGFREAGGDVPTGFDVEMAKLLIADLGIDPNDTDAVTYEPVDSDSREPYLESGRVDIIAASYSITDERRALVGQAGPYYVTGQQILVPSDSDAESIEDLQGEEVCSQSGSTSIENVETEGAVPVPAESYSDCAEDVLNGSVPAMSTDGTILLGLAALNPDELEVRGPEFSEERIGVGYGPDNPEMCEWINGVIQEAYDDGSWEEAFDVTLGESGQDAQDPPELDPCQA